jgi:hypothetical protein
MNRIASFGGAATAGTYFRQPICKIHKRFPVHNFTQKVKPIVQAPDRRLVPGAAGLYRRVNRRRK